jgi:hypothetical protein
MPNVVQVRLFNSGPFDGDEVRVWLCHVENFCCILVWSSLLAKGFLSTPPLHSSQQNGRVDQKCSSSKDVVWCLEVKIRRIYPSIFRVTTVHNFTIWCVSRYFIHDTIRITIRCFDQ